MTATTAQILSLTQFNRLQIANIQSTVSIDASSTGWRSSITSFTALQQYIETQYKASNPATYGNFSSPNLSRALFYMQFVSGLGGYGDPTGGPGGVMTNSVVGNVDPSTVTVQTYLQSPAWMCTDFANVLAFVLNAAGYQTDVIAADGHIFDEVLIDGQWWTLDSQNGFAFQAPWDQVISTSTTPQLYIFTTAGTQAGQPIYRQLLAQATPFLLDWYENGFFPGAYRYQLIDWLKVMPYGQAFLNEMNLTGWTATTPVAIPDYTPDGLSDNDLANVATIYRFGLAHVDSGVSTQASASGWRSSITSLASLKAYIDAQFASSSPAATGNFASSNISRALYYMEWVSGLWAYSGPGGANGAIASGLQSGAASIPSLLSATSAGQLDFATMLSQLFGLAGISTGLLVTGQGDAVVEATIDGQAWTFDPTTGVAYEAPWSSVLAGGTPNVYAFTVEGMRYQSPIYQSSLVDLYYKTLAQASNGVDLPASEVWTTGGVTTQTETWNADGTVHDIHYYGITGQAFTDYDVIFGSNWEPAQIVYSNGVVLTYTWNSSLQVTEIVTTGIQGQAFDKTDVLYGPGGKPVFETWSKAGVTLQTESWNSDGTVHDIHYYGITGQAYTDYDVTYAAGGALQSVHYYGYKGLSYTDNLVTYTSAGVVQDIHYYGVTGLGYTDYDVIYGAGGAVQSIRYFGITGQAYTNYAVNYGAGGVMQDLHFYGITGQPYTDYDVTYAANGQPAQIVYSNGMVDTYSYNSLNQVTELRSTGIQGQAYDATDLLYGSNGNPASKVWSKSGVTIQTETWNADGTVHDIHYYGITGQPYTNYDVTYGAGGVVQDIHYYGVTGQAYTDYDAVYGAGGVVQSIHYYGITGQPYTDYNVVYAANGQPGQITYSNGMVETYSYNSSNQVTAYHATGVQGQAYDAIDLLYGATGKPVSKTWSKGGVAIQTQTWNADGTVHDIHYYGIKGQAYTDYDVIYGANGKPAQVLFSNGLSVTYMWNSSAQLTEMITAGILGQAFDKTDILYATTGKQTFETWSKSGVTIQTEAWNSDGTIQGIHYYGVTGKPYTNYAVNYVGGVAHDVHYYGITGQAYTDYDVTYGAGGVVHDIHYYGIAGQAYTDYDIVFGSNGKPVSMSFSNGMAETLTYDASNNLKEIVYTGIQGKSWDSTDTLYGTTGLRLSETWSKGGVVTMRQTWNADGSVHDVHYYGVTGQPYTDYDVIYGSNGKPASVVCSNGMLETYTYNASGAYRIAFTNVTGQNYGSNDNIYSAANALLAQSRDDLNGTGELSLLGSALTVSVGPGQLGLAAGADSWVFTPHATESITLGGTSTADMFQLHSGFGSVSIGSFIAGANNVRFDAGVFSDLAAMIGNSSASGASGQNLTISGGSGDTLTLLNVLANGATPGSYLTANHASFGV